MEIKLEQGVISGAQLTTLVLGFTLGSALALPPARGATHDAWIAILVGIIEAVLFALIYLALARRFEGKTFVEIGKEVFGKYLGIGVALAYTWFLLLIGSLVIWDYTKFVNLIMPQTPLWVLAGVFCLVCASAVRNGIEVIARCAQVLVPLAILNILSVTVLLFKEIHVENLEPIMEVPIPQLFIAAHDAAVFPFAETVVVLMVIAFLNDGHEGHRAVLKGMVFAGLLLTMISVRNTAVLGDTAAIFTFPSFVAVRRIDYGEIFTRLELILVLNFLTMGFLKLSIFYYGTSLGLAQILGLRSYLPLVLPIGTIMVAMFLNQFNNVPEGLEFAAKTALLHHPIFELGIPLITLIIAIVRKLPKEKK